MQPLVKDVRGAYYTPPAIADIIVHHTIGRLCDDFTPDQLCGLKILDPCCGRGAFLRAAYDYLVNWCRSGYEQRLLSCLYGIDIDPQALDDAKALRIPAANLRHADALLESVGFPGGFDAVIGNPPWVSLAGRFGMDGYSSDKIERMKARFGGNSYMPNVFEYFISLGLELTRFGGYLSFIVPDRLAFNSQFSNLRRRLLAEGELLEVMHGIRFPGVTADAMIFVLRKRPPGPGTMTVSEYGEVISLRPQCQFTDEFTRPQDPMIGLLIEKMESAGGPLLGDICDCASGFGGRSSLNHETRTSDSQIPILRGRSINRYAVERTYWFDFRKENLTGRTVDRRKLGASPKILIRKTGDRLIATYDESGMYPEQSLYFLYNNQSRLDFRFVLGVLNSKLMSLYYQAKCLTNAQTIAHVKKVDLERIPMPGASKAQHDRMVRLVEKRLAGDQSVEQEIDSLVYELYGLEA
jgi:SAM-dependent methyltransferase